MDRDTFTDKDMHYEYQRMESLKRLQSRFEKIFDKYDIEINDDDTDIIDITSLRFIKNTGFVEELPDAEVPSFECLRKRTSSEPVDLLQSKSSDKTTFCSAYSAAASSGGNAIGYDKASMGRPLFVRAVSNLYRAGKRKKHKSSCHRKGNGVDKYSSGRFPAMSLAEKLHLLSPHVPLELLYALEYDPDPQLLSNLYEVHVAKKVCFDDSVAHSGPRSAPEPAPDEDDYFYISLLCKRLCSHTCEDDSFHLRTVCLI